MVVKLRLARWGAKKLPYYRIVAADARAPRDGKFLDIVGKYDPLNHDSNVTFKEDRIKYWLSVGAQPTGRVEKLLDKAGLRKMKAQDFSKQTKTHLPKAKAQARIQAAEEAKAAAEEQAKS